MPITHLGESTQLREKIRSFSELQDIRNLTCKSLKYNQAYNQYNNKHFFKIAFWKYLRARKTACISSVSSICVRQNLWNTDAFQEGPPTQTRRTLLRSSLDRMD